MLYQTMPYEKVWYGKDVVKEHLVHEIKRYQGSRILIVTTNSLMKTEFYQNLLEILKEYRTFIFKSRQHVPIESLVSKYEEIKRFNPDVVVSFGGGSSIDSAKILTMMLFYRISSEDELIDYAINKERTATLSPTLIPHFTIPTTLSAAEFTHSGGFTYQSDGGKKQRLANLAMTPNQIYLDPTYSVETSIDFWISTGLRAVDHAVETLYSPKESPVNQALALESLKYLFQFLPLAKENPQSLEYRLNCQIGSWLSLFSTVNIKTGLSHMIGHQLGSFYGIPHGITSAIMLPNVMEFLKPYTFKKQALLYQALSETGMKRTAFDMSDEEKAAQSAEFIRDLVVRLEIPNKLRDFNVTIESLPAVVESIMEEVKFKEDTFLLALPNLEEGVLSILKKAW